MSPGAEKKRKATLKPAVAPNETSTKNSADWEKKTVSKLRFAFLVLGTNHKKYSPKWWFNGNLPW